MNIHLGKAARRRAKFEAALLAKLKEDSAAGMRTTSARTANDETLAAGVSLAGEDEDMDHYADSDMPVIRLWAARQPNLTENGQALILARIPEDDVVGDFIWREIALRGDITTPSSYRIASYGGKISRQSLAKSPRIGEHLIEKLVYDKETDVALIALGRDDLTYDVLRAGMRRKVSPRVADRARELLRGRFEQSGLTAEEAELAVRAIEQNGEYMSEEEATLAAKSCTNGLTRGGHQSLAVSMKTLPESASFADIRSLTEEIGEQPEKSSAAETREEPTVRSSGGGIKQEKTAISPAPGAHSI